MDSLGPTVVDAYVTMLVEENARLRRERDRWRSKFGQMRRKRDLWHAKFSASAAEARLLRRRLRYQQGTGEYRARRLVA